MLEVKGLHVHFKQKGVLVKALDGVDIVLRQGVTTALAGESGCGKTTFARTVLGFTVPHAGLILFQGKDITKKENAGFLRKNVQIVFQNPTSSIDPRYTVFNTLNEALQVFTKVSKEEAAARIIEVLAQVELTPAILGRYPHELSGGQVQRVCIARALINKPSLIILDEPTSSLDITTASRIVALLMRLQKETGVTFLFISHNLKLVKKISSYCYIMYYGKIVEHGPQALVYNNPLHPYTKMLLAAASQRLAYLSEYAIAAQGCSFEPRCQEKSERCGEPVEFVEYEPGHWVSCSTYR